MKFLIVFLTVIGIAHCGKLAVYWGQDPAGSLHLTLEKSIDHYCSNFEYDIIPVAFLDFFFYPFNKDSFPSINLANHCNKTFDGYPGLLDCPKVASSIKKCQHLGKKILISLGGSAGSYGFKSSSQATVFASTIWNLFFGGQSSVRPFGAIILDGIDLDIEAGTTTYYADFIRAFRTLTGNDQNRKYLITGAPQCPYPDVVMGPGTKGSVLHDVPQEFDYLFVQFYNNYCYLGAVTEFNSSLSDWLNFAENTKQMYNKGPSIFIGLPAHPRASSGARYYETPDVVKSIYQPLQNNPNLGGIMLWDASFDANNIINGKPYSYHIAEFVQTQPKVAICYFYSPFIAPWILIVIGIVTITVSLVVMVFFCSRKKSSDKDKLKYELDLEDVAEMYDIEDRLEKAGLI